MQDSKVGADQLTTGGGVLGSSARGEVWWNDTRSLFLETHSRKVLTETVA